MALFNAGKIDPEALAKEFQPILVEGEKIKRAYKTVRDLYVFTDRRLVIVDRQGITGKKVEYRSIPFRSITQFAVETAGTFDRDAELKIWLSGMHEPLVKEFKKGTDVVAIQKVLATLILQ